MSGDEGPLAATATTGLHGAVAPFDSAQEEWVEYAERLENYFVANDITNEGKQRAIQLHCVGPATYRLIKTLALPGIPRELTFAELVETVKNHFQPKPSLIIKRFEFNTRCQNEGESVVSFVTALQKFAEYCDYGAVLNDMLRDRIVCGIRSKRVQQRLLQEAGLTFERALEIAQATETAENDSKRLQVKEKLFQKETRSQSTRYSSILDEAGDHKKGEDKHSRRLVTDVEASTQQLSASSKNMSAISVTRRGTLPQFVAKEKTMYLKKAQKQF